ncbi:MAG TPA: NAD-dependent deacylase [Thermoanaerobaculia bacterium]|nr:NAD-dependent deacylase [Thermoanaerobaculia bacterium]
MSVDLSPLVPYLSDLRAGRPLAVLTGAGVSAESGLPTFRGADGLWEGHRAEDLATPGAFARDPVKVWRFYEWRREKVRAARPNEAHLALARLESVLPRMTLITQNVDGLHKAAGSRRPIELHGNIMRDRCSGCGAVTAAAPAPFAALPPKCPLCSELLRPDVVWFGEVLPVAAWHEAEAAAEGSAVFLVVGTSSVVAPASSLGLLAARSGAHLFEINPEATPIAPLAEGVFRTSASDVLSAFAMALGAR